MGKEARCSKCKKKYQKTSLIKHKGMLLCEDCYPYIREPNGRLRKKIPQWFDP